MIRAGSNGGSRTEGLTDGGLRADEPDGGLRADEPDEGLRADEPDGGLRADEPDGGAAGCRPGSLLDVTDRPDEFDERTLCAGPLDLVAIARKGRTGAPRERRFGPPRRGVRHPDVH